jgi:hypothetical protein
MCLLVFMLCAEFRGKDARISSIFPSASPSKHIVYLVIIKSLARRRHGDLSALTVCRSVYKTFSYTALLALTHTVPKK